MTHNTQSFNRTLGMKVAMRRALGCAVTILAAACSDEGTTPVTPITPVTPSLDVQVRQAIGFWGVVPILPVNTQDARLVDLGRALFFDKVLSGNRDVSCASCHSPLTNTGDGLSLAIGTGATHSGATRTLGTGRQFTPRNAPALFSTGLRPFYMFWDGQVNEEGGPGRFNTPAGAVLPAGLTSLLAAQA